MLTVKYAFCTKKHCLISPWSLSHRGLFSPPCEWASHNDITWKPVNLHWYLIFKQYPGSNGDSWRRHVLMLKCMSLRTQFPAPSLSFWSQRGLSHIAGSHLRPISDIQLQASSRLIRERELVISTVTLPPGYISVPSDSHRSRCDSALHIQSLLQPGGGGPVTTGQTQSL